MAFSQEIKIEVVKNNLKFKEVDIQYNERLGNVKLDRLKDGVRNLYFIFHKKFNFNKYTPLYIAGIVLVLGMYLFLSLQHISDPFTGVTEDENGNIGIAAENLARLGVIDLKLGIHTSLVNSSSELAPPYLHHPPFYILPTVLVYKIWGISEMTTRVGPMLLNLLVLSLFFYALWIFYNKKFLPTFLTSLVISFLPGFIYYGKMTSHVSYLVFSYLLVFSTFIFFLKSDKKNKLSTGFLIFSIICSGMLHWFGYFLPITIWIFSLFSFKHLPLKKRNILRYIIPLSLVVVSIINISYIYLLGGQAALIGLKSSYGFRSSINQSFGQWLSFLVKERSVLNFTWFFVTSGLIGLFVFVYSYLTKKIENDNKSLLVLWIAPLLMTYVFSQWITHPFGVLVFLPAIAVFTGWLFSMIVQKFRTVGVVVVVFLLAFGFFLSIKKLNYFYDSFHILDKQDIELIKTVGPKLNDGDLCLKENEMGIGYHGIIEWYIQKRLGIFKENTCSYMLFFRGGISQKYFDEQAKELEIMGFRKTLGCAEWLCLSEK